MKDQFRESFRRALVHSPTNGQAAAIDAIADFSEDSEEHAVFLLRGFAGTGKTSLIGALVKVLASRNQGIVLLAPTGRAARVLSAYTGKPAQTIHSKIYRYVQYAHGAFFQLVHAAHCNTWFIVDEASLIPFAQSDEQALRSNVLEDLFEYVGAGQSGKLLFCGDLAQLPPVGASFSPALDPVFLKSTFYSKVFKADLTDVVRQEKDSGILVNATFLRSVLSQTNPVIRFQASAFPDVKQLAGADLEDALYSSFREFGEDGVVFICRSNKRALAFNREIRSRIFFREELLSVDDRIMAVKNTAFWTKDHPSAGFIANGEMMRVSRIKRRYEERYGHVFADVTLQLFEQDHEPEVEVKILVSMLNEESPALSNKDRVLLGEKIMEDMDPDLPHGARQAQLKKDPYFQAVQVKFAWAITCHKAQGGQWPVVFIDQGFLTSDMVNQDLVRWFYTALTRASQQVFLVNFSPEFVV